MLNAGVARAQAADALPSLRVSVVKGAIQLDGLLDQESWATADSIDGLTMIEPAQGGTPSGRTLVRVLATREALYIGVICEDADPRGIVSFTKQRDGSLRSEDHIRIVFDTFLDGRSGYVFQVNPSGARYDALINAGGDNENSNWDGVWDAATGTLDQILLTGALHPSPLFTLELSAERDVGDLREGRFTTTLVGTRGRVNVSPDLQIASYVQYDTVSRSVGTNTRLRWTFHPLGDLFVIYNHNVRDIQDRWQLDSNQLLIKLQYAFRY